MSDLLSFPAAKHPGNAKLIPQAISRSLMILYEWSKLHLIFIKVGPLAGFRFAG
jgi:hypothetical protein